MKHDPIDLPQQKYASDLLKPADLYVSAVLAYTEKCRSSSVSTLFSGILGGSLIGFAGLFYLVVMSDNALSGGIAKLLGGASFSLGLVMISIIGAELFTGNIMAALAVGYRRITSAQILRNWSAVFISNFIGTIAVAVGAAMSGLLDDNATKSLDSLVSAKLSQTMQSTFIEAILCNILVCLAIWMGLATRSPSGRILCIAGPITAFVAIGLEHCIANMFFFASAVFSGAAEMYWEMAVQLTVVTAGNIVGALLLCLLLAQTFRHAPGVGKRLSTGRQEVSLP